MGMQDTLDKVSHAVHNAMETTFSRIATVVVSWPWAVIGGTVLMTVVMGQGVWFYQEETKEENQFTPPNSRAKKENVWVEDFYGEAERRAVTYIIAREGDRNMLTKPRLLQMMDYHQWFIKFQAGNTSFPDLCLKDDTGECLPPASVLTFWNHNKTLLELDPNPVGTVNTIAWRTLHPTGPPLSYYLSTTKSDAAGNIVSAEAMRLEYVLHSNDIDWVVGYEEQITDAASSEKRDLPLGIQSYLHTDGGQDKAAEEAISNDLSSLIAGYMMMVVYSSLVLGRQRFTYSHASLGLLTVVSVLMSTFSAYGLMWYIGVKFNNVTQVLILVLLGIGIDDTFVIMDSWWDAAHIPDMKERMIAALRHAGPAITVTSLTDCVAFLAGSGTVFPALRDFCYYAATGIAFDFLYQSTFFVALAYLSSLRQESSRPDFLCCIKVSSDAGICVNKNRAFHEARRGVFTRFISTTLPKVLMSTPGRVVSIVLTIVFFALGIYGCTVIRVNFSNEWFVPDGTDGRTVLNARDDFFPGSSAPVDFYFSDLVDHAASQGFMNTTITSATGSKWVVPGTTDFYLWSFTRWVAMNHAASINTTDGGVVQNDFYSLLKLFLATSTGPPEGASQYRNVMWNEDGTAVETSRASFFIIRDPMDDGEDAIECLGRLRGDVAVYGTERVFPFAFFFVFWEGYKELVPEVTRNIAVAAACVFSIVTVTLANVLMGVIVVVIIGCVDVCLLGFMYYFGVDFNAVSIICLVVAIGLAVDYSVHIAHSYLQVKGPRPDRAAYALWKMGPAVVNGGFSTFLAVFPLVTAKSYIFTVFFRMFVLIIFFGLWFGVVVLPVFLSFVGPAPYISAEDLETMTHMNPLSNDNLKVHPDTNEMEESKDEKDV
eukprot:TRINITY_DN2517_c0_g2_i10.p1 TRINITY_DN2517_c0_g2~~TRINITY_DN2517_c0_g2_i10.p1  ORF type:complete len:881 (+),score=122.77 TRINITY_DN2517_c0_g2_i10:721-3363(+)